MKQTDDWSKAYAAGLAINKSCLRQSNAFDKSVEFHLHHFFSNYVECCDLVEIHTDVQREFD